MENENKNLITTVENLLLNILTIPHQLVISLLLIGKSYDTNHQIERIGQYLNFFKIIIIISIVILITQIFSVLGGGNEPDYAFFGNAILLLLYVIAYNLTIYTIYVHKVSFTIEEGGLKTFFFILIPIVLLIMSFSGVDYASFTNSIYYLLTLLIFNVKFKNGASLVPNTFWNKSLNSFWDRKNVNKTSGFLLLILILNVVFSLFLDYVKASSHELQMPNDISTQNDLNLYLDIGLLILTLTSFANKK